MSHNNQWCVVTIFYLLVNKLMDQSIKKLVHHMVLMQTVFSAPPMYDPLDQDLGSQSQTALQQHHRPPIFMVPMGWQCQGRAMVGKVSKFEC